MWHQIHSNGFGPKPLEAKKKPDQNTYNIYLHVLLMCIFNARWLFVFGLWMELWSIFHLPVIRPCFKFYCIFHGIFGIVLNGIRRANKEGETRESYIKNLMIIMKGIFFFSIMNVNNSTLFQNRINKSTANCCIWFAGMCLPSVRAWELQACWKRHAIFGTYLEDLSFHCIIKFRYS